MRLVPRPAAALAALVLVAHPALAADLRPFEDAPLNAVSDPRTVISGPKSEVDFVCGVAVDPIHRELYGANNDTDSAVMAFKYGTNGEVPPARKIETAATGTWGVALDLKNDEVAVTVEHINRVEVYRREAVGDEKPLRIIQGPHVKFGGNRLDVDPVHNEIFLPEGSRIRVYPRDGNGDVAPIRTIEGPDTLLKNAESVVVDPINNIIAVGFNKQPYDEDTGSILIFDRTANGNVKPKMTIEGPRKLGGPFAIYPPKQLIFATNQTASEGMAGDDSYLGVWSYEKSSDGPPLWTIGGPNGIFQMPRGVALDVKNKNIFATDKRLNSVLTFQLSAQRS